MKWSKSSFNAKSSDVEVGTRNVKKPATKQLRGENHFNKIPILSTPAKRKIENESDTNVSFLTRHFDSMPASKPGQHSLGESPAKRRK